jgi:hypothetical protein
MLAALTEGQAYESRWIGNTLAVAVIEREQPRIVTFTKEGLLSWYERAWSYGATNTDLEFGACVFATFEQQPELLAIDQCEAA